MSGEAKEIGERLVAVERSLRRYRAALVAVGLMAAAWLAGAPLVGAGRAPAVIDAKQFRVVDDSGRPRALLGMDGFPTLILFDKTGKVRADLSAVGDDTALTLADKAGKTRAVLGNEDLELPASGSTEHRAASSLVLFNGQGRVLWEAP